MNRNGKSKMTDPEIQAGAIVEKPNKPEWGPGKVVHVRNGLLHVFFRDESRREGRRYRSHDLRLADVQTDPILDNLPPIVEKDGYFLLPKNRMSPTSARERFLHYFPAGFADPAFTGTPTHGERFYKWQAHERLAEILEPERGRAQVAEGRASELGREAMRALGTAGNLLAVSEITALREGLEDEPAARQYFSSLFDLVENGPGEEAFAAHAEAAESLPVKGKTSGARWPTVTIFPYLLRPDAFMLVKPDATKESAQNLACDIRYDPNPNWNTYSAVLDMARTWMDELSDLGPRDFIDIQSFFWVTCDSYEKTRAAQEKKRAKRAASR